MYRNLECALEREAERARREVALTVEKGKNEDSDDIIILESEADVEKKKNEKKDEKKVDPRQNFKSLVSSFDAFASFAHFDENICGFVLFCFNKN